MTSPIFIIGTQRSGTTLLCRMLTAHPDIFIKNEVPVRRVFTAGAGRQQIENAIDFYIRKRYGKSLDELLQTENKTLWGLKDPELTSYLDTLKREFPNSKYIIITRDPRAVVNSYMGNRWGLGTNAYTGALRWLDETRKQLQFEKEMGTKCLRLRFEDLVSNQAMNLQAIADFLGVPFDEKMINYQNEKTFIAKGRENENTLRSLDKRIVSKWHNQLTRKQIEIIDYVACSVYQQTGYGVQSELYKPNLLEIRWYKMHQLILGECQIQYQIRIKPKLKIWQRREDTKKTVST